MSAPAVLIIEDEVSIRRLLVTMVKREGLAAEGTGDGNEGLALIRSGRFGLVLLDLMLPSLSGYDILASCRDLPAESRPIFIVMTAFTRAYRSALDEDLVTAIIQKPFDIHFLSGVIRDTLQAFHRGGAAGGDVVRLPIRGIEETPAPSRDEPIREGEPDADGGGVTMAPES